MLRHALLAFAADGLPVIGGNELLRWDLFGLQGGSQVIERFLVAFIGELPGAEMAGDGLPGLQLPECFHRLPDDELDKDFLLEIERRVSADSVIVIDQVEYEVDCRFAKQRIKLRYSPDLKDIFIVEADGTLTPIRLLNKTENAFIKREKIHLCRGEEV